MKNNTIIISILLLTIISLSKFSFSQTFTKIETGVIAENLGPSAGSSWGDYDNDGLLDLFVSNNTLNVGGTKNFLYHNEGNCYFTKIESGPIVAEIGSFGGSVWGDYDNDGYLDLVVTKRDGNVMLFRNNTNGDFEKVYSTPMSGLNEHFMGSSWIDLNNDGHLDLFLNSYGKNYLFQNQGDGNFFKINSSVLTTTGRNSVICSWADYDNDEDFDLFISVYVGTNSFYINNGDGSFTLDNENNIINDEYSTGGSWGDCNNDGYLDLYVVNQDDQSTSNSLYLNNGDGTFEKVTSGDVVSDKGVSIGSSWGDFDNDSDLDLFVSNYDFQGHKNCLYINNGYGEFTKITEGMIVNDNGEDNTICDFDNDGDLDIFITNGGGFGAPSANYLYVNDGNENNWININFIGTISNKNGIGVKVKVKANIFGSDVWQMREITQQNGSFGHSSLRAHFGLGDASLIDSLIVLWPAGNPQILTNVSANQFLSLTESSLYQHDLTVLPNLEEFKSPTNFTNFVPEVSVRNIVTLDEYNVTVSCAIDTAGVLIYSEDVVLDTVNSLEVRKAKFKSFPIPSSARYHVKYFTQLSGDENVLNDSLTTHFESSNLIDDFENGLIKWDYNHTGTEASSGFMYSGNFGLNIKYDNGAESWAEFTTSFNFSQLSNAYLSFWTRYFFEANKDFAYTEISVDGGNSWVQIGEVFTGVLISWNQQLVDLQNFCGPGFEDVRIRFNVVPDSTTVLPGWYIDDIFIQGGSTDISTNSSKTINDYELYKNYPNPFNARTAIEYKLSKSASVKINIYNLLGQKIVTLINKKQTSGRHKIIWDGKDKHHLMVPSGVYLYKIETNEFCQSKKMLLLK